MGTAMIWGANGGIGSALVTRLVEAGWSVVAIGRQPPARLAPAVHWIEADVTSPYAVEVAVHQAAQVATDLDLWIYCVGDITAAKVGEMKVAAWSQILNANLTGAFLTTQASLPLLAEAAHLVYIGAVSERLRLPGLSAYAAAKSGLEAFVEVVRKEQRRQRVTLIRPPAVATAFWEKVPLRLPPNALSSQAVADAVFTAHQQGVSGVIDLGG